MILAEFKIYFVKSFERKKCSVNHKLTKYFVNCCQVFQESFQSVILTVLQNSEFFLKETKFQEGISVNV